MFVGRRGTVLLSGCGLLVALVTRGEPALAQVKQTDAANTPLPQPVGFAESSLVNDSWGWNANTISNRDPNGVNHNPGIRYGDYYSPPTFPQFVTGDAISLSGLFKWRKEAIDPVRDARTAPGYFSAKCGFTAQLLLRGGSCPAQLGWYNVTDPTSKTPPSSNEIFPVVTGKPQDQLNCLEQDGKTRKNDGFCPLAWDNRSPYDLSIVRWTPKSFNSGELAQLAQYKGGYVGLAVIGDPLKCPQNKFSMYEHNQRNANGVPWVTSLIYQSKLDASGFYLAFEDLPMSADDWKTTNSGVSGADGDFNDLVFYVSGLTCAGGNQPCNTGQFGACAIGRTDCAAGSEPTACRPVSKERSEICDNIDNDCDGLVDDGPGLCPDSNAPICFQGACVASCKNFAFPCPLGLACDDSGRCVDPACSAVSCAPGTICHHGACGDPCAGVLCPYGSQCELGQCIDPCAGVSCPSAQVCDRGVCVGNCSCNGCATGLSCGADGRCTDAACAGKACSPGTICRLGDCVDPCAGVSCPNKGSCSNGVCSSPSGSAGQGGGGAISFGGNPAVSAGSAGTLSGAGTTGKGGTGNAAGIQGDAGTENEAGGADAAGGEDSAGGAHAGSGATAAGSANVSGGDGDSSDTATEASSSCGCAVPGQTESERALPVWGLLIGAAFIRRSRRSALARRSRRRH